MNPRPEASPATLRNRSDLVDMSSPLLRITTDTKLLATDWTYGETGIAELVVATTSKKRRFLTIAMPSSVVPFLGSGAGRSIFKMNDRV